MASDSLNENYTTIVMHVKDANDLPPVFNQTHYTAKIAEELPGNYPLRLMQVRPIVFHSFGTRDKLRRVFMEINCDAPATMHVLLSYSRVISLAAPVVYLRKPKLV